MKLNHVAEITITFTEEEVKALYYSIFVERASVPLREVADRIESELGKFLIDKDII